MRRPLTLARYPVTILVIGYLAHVLWRVWLIRDCQVPAAHADEDGYLLAARALAGGAGGYSTENILFRRVGYPLLIAPVYWLASDPFRVYQLAQLIGVLVNSLVFPLSALFASRVLGMGRARALGMGFVAAALPAVVFYTGMAMTEVLLPTMLLAWLCLLHEGVRAGAGGQRMVWQIGASVMAGAIATVHIRGLMVLVVHVVVVLALAGRRRTRPAVAGCSLAVAALIASADVLAKWALGTEIVVVGGNPASQIGVATTADWAIGLVVFRVVGQLWYLCVATLGAAAVGVIAVVTRSERLLGARGDEARDARVWTLTALLAATALIALGSAASLPFGDRRITYIVYPRYLHPLYPMWFMTGLAAVLATATEQLPTRVRAARLRGPVGLVALLALVVGWRVGIARGYWFLAFDVPETAVLGWTWDRLSVLAPTLIALGTLVLASVVPRGRRMAALGLVGALTVCGVSAEAAHRNIITPMVSGQYTASTPLLSRDLGLGPDDVVAEAWQVSFPALYNHMREVTWQRLLLFDVNVGPPAEANVVIAPWYGAGISGSWDGSELGMAQIGVDVDHSWAAWRRS